MKKAIFGLLVLLTCTSTSAAATTDFETENAIIVRKQMSKFLRFHTLELKEDVVVRVKVKINRHNRVEVLEIFSEDKEVRNYINRALNNRKVEEGIQDDLQTYNLPVRLTVAL